MLKYFKYSVNTKIHSAYAATWVDELKSVHLNAICLHFLPYLLNICRKFEFLIFQGSVATCIRWGGYSCTNFVANFIRFPAVQKFWKSAKIRQSYEEFKGGNFFETQCTLPSTLTVYNTFYSASAFLAMQTAVKARAILSVCLSVHLSLSVCHIPVFCSEELL